MQGSGSAAQGEISFLSWNSKVQHILASTSYNGTTGEDKNRIFKLLVFYLLLFVMCSIFFSSGLGPKEAKTSNKVIFFATNMKSSFFFWGTLGYA